MGAHSTCRIECVLQVYGASVSPAEIVVVSDFVEGGTLRDLLENRVHRKQLTTRCVYYGFAEMKWRGYRGIGANGENSCIVRGWYTGCPFMGFRIQPRVAATLARLS